MSQGSIETLHNEGRWHNVVAGTDQVSEPFDSMEEAVEEGRAMAEELGMEHVVKNIDGTVLQQTPGD